MSSHCKNRYAALQPQHKQTSASAKTDNDYQYSNVIFGFKNKKSKDIPTYKMSETFKIADVEYTIHTKEVV